MLASAIKLGDKSDREENIRLSARIFHSLTTLVGGCSTSRDLRHVVQGRDALLNVAALERTQSTLPFPNPSFRLLVGVDVLQEQLDKKLLERQALETGICPVREDLYTQAFGTSSCLTTTVGVQHDVLCACSASIHSLSSEAYSATTCTIAAAGVEAFGVHRVDTVETEIGCCSPALLPDRTAIGVPFDRCSLCVFSPKCIPDLHEQHGVVGRIVAWSLA